MQVSQLEREGHTVTTGRITIMRPHPERVHRMSRTPKDWPEDSPSMKLFHNAQAWDGYLTNVWAFDSGNRFDYSFHVTTPALPHSSGHGTSVPETASTLALLGGTLISLATLRRQLMI